MGNLWECVLFTEQLADWWKFWAIFGKCLGHVKLGCAEKFAVLFKSTECIGSDAKLLSPITKYWRLGRWASARLSGPAAPSIPWRRRFGGVITRNLLDVVKTLYDLSSCLSDGRTDGRRANISWRSRLFTHYRRGITPNFAYKQYFSFIQMLQSRWRLNYPCMHSIQHLSLLGMSS